MKTTRIELQSNTLGRQSFSPEHAARLIARRGSWRLPDDSAFEFDGASFKVKEVVVVKQKPVAKKTVKKQVTKKVKKDVIDSANHIGDTAAPKQDANDTSSKKS